MGLSVKNKIFLIMGLVALTTLVQMGLSQYAASTIIELEQEAVLITEIEAGMLMLRRNEKDFLARKDLKYLKKFDANHEALLAKAEDLSARLEGTGIDSAKPRQIGGHFADYGERFRQLVKVQQQIGLHAKDGLYGSLREAVHGVEKLVKEQQDYHLLNDMLMLRRNEKDFMLRDNLKYIGKFDKNIAKFEATLAASEMPDDVKSQVSAALAKYRTDFLALVEGYKRKGLSPKEGLRGEMRGTVHKSEELLKSLKADVLAAVEDYVGQSEILSHGISVVLLLLLMATLFLVSRSIVRPVNALSGIMASAAANRDLSLRGDDSGKDEISVMARAFNDMMAEFQGVLSQVVSSANKVSNASGELSTVTEKTTAGVQQQKAESDQVATAMNEMAATVQEVAHHAADAANASKVADEEAEKGRQVVGQAADGIRGLVSEVENTATVIQQLEQESENIGTVLNVITGIAEQTNLLALNAAIEAARAGEQGRGFAVVADEVRTLAQRSQQSTEEIKAIIDRLQSQAQNAVSAMDVGRNQAQTTVEQAEAAAASLQAITDAVTAISDMNTQIASAAEEQSAVAEEINRSVVNIAQVAEETANDSLQTRHTTSDLAGLAAELQERVGVFRLQEGASAVDLSKAKAAHLAWKARLRDFLDGRSNLTLDEAVSHKHCVLGKWYYSEGLENFGHIHEMHELEEPHAEMHGLIREIIEAKQKGDNQGAERMFRQIDPLSREIVAMLEAVEHKSAA